MALSPHNGPSDVGSIPCEGEEPCNNSPNLRPKRIALVPCRVDQGLDKISQLPKLLIDKILLYLPIRDAVRTSVLSSKWRCKWTALSKLVFDDECTRFRGLGDQSSTSKLVKIIDNVLLLHSGSIEKFKLSHRQYKATADIDRWIHYLSKASMSEFILHVWKGPYKVPSCLFSCQSLTQLVLYNCSVNLPPTFRGFKKLKSLHLQMVPMSKQVLENLISGSPLLWGLVLIDYHFKNLNINVPKLGYLRLDGLLEDISFTNTYCSPSFQMELHEKKTHLSVRVNAVTGYINLLKFIAPFRNVKTLRLDGHTLKYLSIQEVPTILAEPFLRLKALFISGVHFKSVKEILVILCLLRSGPNLNEVVFSAPKNGDQANEHTDSSGIEICESPCTFPNLNSASLIGIHHDCALEMGFIGILLSSSPALQKM